MIVFNVGHYSKNKPNIISRIRNECVLWQHLQQKDTDVKIENWEHLKQKAIGTAKHTEQRNMLHKGRNTCKYTSDKGMAFVSIMNSQTE